MAESKVTMKLLIDTKSRRVMFAEAGKECVDFLFYILALSVGSLIRLLMAKGMVGSLGNLYESLQNLDNMYIQPNQNKDILLKPKSAFSFPLLLPTYSHVERQLYRCPSHDNYVTDDPRVCCPSTSGSIDIYDNPDYYFDYETERRPSYCGVSMDTKLEYVAPSEGNAVASNGVMVKGVVTYMVLDDLVVKPMSTISSISLLNEFSITDVSVLKERVVTLGMDEALKLLKTSLQSKSVLTSVFMDNTKE